MTFLLVLTNIGGQFSKYVLGYDYLKGLVPLFQINGEGNIPAYFSVLLILFAALLLAVITLLNAKQNAPYVTRWAVLACGFVIMAFDEAFQVHERLIDPVRAMLGDGSYGVFYFAWVIPGIALVLVLGLFFLRFLLDLSAKSRLRFLTAGALYVGGAIGVELIGGRHVDLHGSLNFTYSMIVTLEEGLEMAGLVVFIWALLKYCADHYEEVRFRFLD